MSEKPPFDTVKASFYLIAAILSFQCLMIAFAAIACFLILFDASVAAGKIECYKDGKLGELLSNALAAALAFAGGFTRRDK